MKIANYNWVWIILLMTGSIIAAPEEAQTSETTPTATEIIDADEKEAASDARDAIHENLDTMNDDIDAVTDLELKSEQEKINTTPEELATEAEQPQSFFSYIRSIPGYLQSVPDRLPWIRERELIFFGRAEIDGAYYSSDLLNGDTGFRVRSLRVGLAKAFKYNVSVKAEIDLTDGDNNFTDLYGRYRHKRYGIFTVGNQRVAQTLVNQTSRISRTFMEEPLPAEAFGLGRRLALGWDTHFKRGGAHVTTFGPDLNGSIGDYGTAGRIYLNPSRERFSVFHIGGSIVSESMSRKTRFFSHPESRVTSTRLVDTGLYENVTHQHIYGVELAGAKNSFMFRSEFFRATWSQTASKDPVFKGFYLQASKILSGESFKYTQGKFLRIRPQNKNGAWEAAIRYSNVDLNDQDVTGGEQKNLSIALNWYSSGNQFRVMSNLIFVNTDEFASDEDSTIFQVRAQLHW